jgi:hypothetical protein
VVVIVNVEVAPLLVGVTGFVENALLALHEGAGDPVPLTLHDMVTGRLYVFNEVSVTVDVPELPGLTAVGVVAATVKSGMVAGLYAVTKASVQGTLIVPETQVPPP